VDGSSTDILLKRIQQALVDKIGSRAEVVATFVKLNSLKFIACQSCGEAPTEGYCLFEDDLTPVYNKLVECDCLLIGSPIYFDSVSAQTKMFIDRCNCIRPPDWKDTDPDHDFIKLLGKKRPGAMVLVGGEQGYFEGARRTIAGLFKWVEVTNEGYLKYASNDFRKRGEAAENPDTLKQADELGHKLAGLLGYNR
jgi:multimeric flavodoxin WrbA